LIPPHLIRVNSNSLLTVCGFLQVACQGFLVREACVGVLVAGAVFLLSGVQGNVQ